ncbi:ATP-binding cassette domain-containing protein [Mucilaginibacter sp. BT774]|uniref:ATP-binding cassette domain-containing protein n=1 Tax=Mucilaginibacter sp. BT774 TaxID=3062276 RepID=UPI0026751BCE|nr:ATP-binding cassette domain-containing protein [Mucilaginibacter sp. BT774]MDO3627108.1 ATP-binding cassette domain-containing protein [Mucilaginibacter sp. BT774]
MISIDIEKKLKAYRGEQILKISAQFDKSSITKIYGPSGAGKSTFLRIIAGLVEPEHGKISVDDMVWLDTLSKISLSPQKRKVGLVFQNYALFPNMTVRQHLEYVSDDTQWINRLLFIGKLETFTSHKPEYLSGGQQQRLAILRAMAIKPKLMLMDEPFSALDPKMKSELIPGLKSIWDELGTTVLIVSHNPQELVGLTATEMEINPI